MSVSATWGKKRQLAKLAEEAIADFQKSETLEDARSAVAHMQEKWANKIGDIIKSAEDIGTATTYAQIRERVADVKENRLAFLEKHASDPVVASALLTAPPFLSNLSEAEITLVKHKIEKAAISPEVAEARSATEKALRDAEHGWSHAMNMIARRGGVEEKEKRKVA